MKVALIAHGNMRIPPTAWGAVEETLWIRKGHIERLGHSVDIFNSRALHLTLDQINEADYDFVHCHNELFVLDCVNHLRAPLAVTSHTAVSLDGNGEYGYRGASRYLFLDTLEAPANIVLSDRIAGIYRREGYTGLLHVLPNGAEVDRFREVARGNGKAVCVGRIIDRKRQAQLSDIVRGRVTVDFVGPWDRNGGSAFSEHKTAKYLGVWDRQTLHERLGEYSCLVLLSRAEAAPKVVPEALAAGLSVVVSEACTANLTDEEFVTVIPDEESESDIIADRIQAAIDRNDALRADARAYARERFDYSIVVAQYAHIIEEIRAFSPLGRARIAL